MVDTPLLSFDYGHVLAGAASGLVLSVLLRNPVVATLVATSLAGGLVWTIAMDPSGPTAFFEFAAERLSQLATQGFLTGALLAKAAVGLVEGLGRAGRRRRR